MEWFDSLALWTQDISPGRTIRQDAASLQDVPFPQDGTCADAAIHDRIGRERIPRTVLS